MSKVYEGIFSVIMVGLLTASRIKLRYREITVSLDLRDWMKAKMETASYESMFNTLEGNKDDGTLP